MKTNIISFLILAGLLIVFPGKAEGPKSDQATNSKDVTLYEVNVEDSQVEWTGQKIVYSHNGTVELSQGELKMEGNKLVGGYFELEMNTIENLDLEDPKDNQKLVNHLKSKDFFDVKKYPKAIFEVTKAIEETNGENNYLLTGDLTIKGITRPLSFPARLEMEDETIKASATMTFDRSEYEIKYKSGSFFENLGDNIIYDDVEMSIKLIASKSSS